MKRSHIVEGVITGTCRNHNIRTQTGPMKKYVCNERRNLTSLHSVKMPAASAVVTSSRHVCICTCMYLSQMRNSLLASDILHWSPETPSLVISRCQSRTLRNKGAESGAAAIAIRLAFRATLSLSLHVHTTCMGRPHHSGKFLSCP